MSIVPSQSNDVLVDARRILRRFTAVILAAVISAIAYIALTPQDNSLLSAFIVSLIHVTAVGLPAVALFWRLGLMGPVPAVLAGWLAAATGLLVFTLFVSQGSPTGPDWRFFREPLSRFSLVGASGGLGFWLWLQCTGGLPNNKSVGVRLSIPVQAVGTAVLIAVIWLGAFLLRDRTCHNDLLDEERQVVYKLSLVLQVPDDEWSSLTEAMHELASQRSWEFRDASVAHTRFRRLWLSACSEEGTRIGIREGRWTDPSMAGPPNPGIRIHVAEPRQDQAWRNMAHSLVAALERRWPGRLEFRDQAGEPIPRPAEFLKPTPDARSP